MIEKKRYRLPFVLLAFGLVFSIGSAIANVHSEENWFSRSGAILTFVSVVVQFMLSNLRKEELEKLFHSGNGLTDKFKKIRKRNPIFETLYVASGVTGLAGTLIWGYGDLLFK